MSNAPKVQGFFQTIPGLITATAGLLSAATGAIVALNQTGVIELKKSDVKPPEQVAPFTSPTVTNAARQEPKPSHPSDAGAVMTAGKPDSEPSASERSPAKSEPPPSAETAKSVEAKPTSIEPNPTPSPTSPEPAGQVADSRTDISKSEPTSPIAAARSSTADAERLKAIQDGAAAAKPNSTPNTKSAEVPVSKPATPPITEPQRTPANTRVTEMQSEPTRPAPATPPVRTAESDPSAVPAKMVESPPPVVRAPSSGPAMSREPSRPVPGDQVADSRTGQRADGPVEDSHGAKIVRPPADVVRAPDVQPGSKRLVDHDGRGRSPQVVRGAGGAGPRELDLTGLKLAIPSGWMPEPVEAGPMAPVAALRIPDPSGDGVVQISRYLGSKGDLEEKAINRWLGMVSRQGGGPATRADAKIERIQVGAIRITTVDMVGTVKRSPRDAGEPNQRMLAAIIDHPAGPHLVTITGPARSMANWDAAIDGFLRSAKAD